MTGDPFMALTIGEIVRRDMGLVGVLAELGIGPRYVAWRMPDAARDLQLDPSEVARRLAGAAGVAA